MTIHPIYGSNGIIDTFKLKYFLKIFVVIVVTSYLCLVLSLLKVKE